MTSPSAYSSGPPVLLLMRIQRAQPVGPPSPRAGASRLFHRHGDAVLARGEGDTALHLGPVFGVVVPPARILHGPMAQHHVAPMLLPSCSCPSLWAVDKITRDERCNREIVTAVDPVDTGGGGDDSAVHSDNE